jgi:5-methylthioadenosine/S-adenosylhomocysteine deaminase
MAKSLLIEKALVVSPGQAPFHGWVSVAGNRIDAVGSEQAPAAPDFERVIDAQGAPLIPGLINAHAHSQSTLTRGSAEGLPLDEWLPIIFEEMRRLTDEQAYCAALLTYAEALLSGTTCIMDMCQRPQAAARAAEALGIRAVLAPYLADSMAFAPSLEENEALIRSINGRDGRVRVWVGIAGMVSSSPAQLEQALDLARRHGVGFHTHCAETMPEIERSRALTGRTPVARLDELSALGPDTVLAHCVWLSDDDRDILAARGVHIVHCPQSNLKLGSGIAPTPDYLQRGINVALGTDGAKANNRLDLFDTMKFASLVPKGLARDPRVLSSNEVFAMATSNGARALGLDCGRISPGAKADLVLLRGNALNLQPVLPQNILPNVVHAAHGGDADCVIVDGRVVVEGGKLLTIDQAELAARVRAAAEILQAR